MVHLHPQFLRSLRSHLVIPLERSLFFHCYDCAKNFKQE
jgi:hypothetical protein